MSVNFTGTWNANLSKSRLLGPPPTAMTVRIEHAEPTLVEEIRITKSNGSQVHATFQCSTSGDQLKGLLDGKEIKASASWEGEELIVESWIQFGPRELHFRDCWSPSADGQTLTMEHRNDDLAGQLTFLERVG